MKNNSDVNYQSRATIGVGASVGAIAGALLGEILSDSHLVVILCLTIFAGLGAAVGSRVKSQAPQFLWVEYPKKVAQRLLFSGALFIALFLTSIILIKTGAKLWVQITLLSATSVSTLFLYHSVGYAISHLDDLLRKILLEGIGIGFGLSTFMALILGLYSLAIPIRSDWLITFIILCASSLIGRFVVAWRYR